MPFGLFAVLDKLLNFLRLGRLFHKTDAEIKGHCVQRGQRVLDNTNKYSTSHTYVNNMKYLSGESHVL